MSKELLDRLDEWKLRFGCPDTGPLEQILAEIMSSRFADADALIRLHETLLFLRAYPPSRKVAKLADKILFSFANRIAELESAGGDLSPFEEPEVSGIAGTSLAGVFGYEVARCLASRHPRNVEIAWDRYDETDKLGSVMSRFVPLLEEDWPVEAHPPYHEWVSAARRRGVTDLAWLLERVDSLSLAARDRADRYDSMQSPILWRMGNGLTSRSRLRLPGRNLFVHTDALLRRSDISLAGELNSPALSTKRLSKAEGRKILDLIMDTSAMRYRELYGFSHPDEAGVFHADAGRGVDIYFFGVPPPWRLPLRAYHAGMFFKNGVPAGYVELLSLFERAEVGFNMYYTFREGESAWLFARILRLFRQVLGVTCFSVDPYQIGQQNSEAIDSGAFWFYRKLGFRPTNPEVVRLVQREERRITDDKKRSSVPLRYRSSRSTLERLANGYLSYSPGEDRTWDTFQVRKIGMAVQRANPGAKTSSDLELALSLIPDFALWTTGEKTDLAKIVRAKKEGAESSYLRLMQHHTRLRQAFLKLGS